MIPEDFMPHSVCLQGDALLLWGFLLTNGATFVAYETIAISLLFAARGKSFAIHTIWTLLAAFVILCGLTHLIDCVVLFYPVYKTELVFLSLTAVVSLAAMVLVLARIDDLREFLGCASEMEQRQSQIEALLQQTEKHRELRERQDKTSQQLDKMGSDLRATETATSLPCT